MFHYAHAKYLSQFNLHVFCEKPIAMTPGEAQELVDLYKENNKILQVGFHLRFQPVSRFIKNAIAERTFVIITEHSAEMRMGRQRPTDLNSE
jgi:predicted dehydrogenase